MCKDNNNPLLSHNRTNYFCVIFQKRMPARTVKSSIEPVKK